jgi:hypothetical protein
VELRAGPVFCSFIAPLGMPLRIGSKLNPKALALAEMAFNRKLLI